MKVFSLSILDGKLEWSVLYSLYTDCTVTQAFDSRRKRNAPMSMGATRRFLLHYANEHLDFRLPELKSIVELLGIKINIKNEATERKNPFLVVDLPSEDTAKQILNRTMLIRSAYELWTESKTFDKLHQNLANLPEELTAPYTTENSTFRIVVEAFNKKIPPKQKIKRIEDLPWVEMGLKGKIKLKNPDHSFHLFEYYKFPEGMHSASEPSHLYFGRLIADGQRDQIQHYKLQNRCFIGNTSMDAGLSFIMANMGHISKNKLVFDPFVGSGSLLVACAHFDAYVMGADLDYLLLHGRARPSRHNQKERNANESIRSNLIQYGLGHLYLDAIVADSSKHEMWHRKEIFDAIITDPPYGIREPAKKIAANGKRTLLPERVFHAPEKTQYRLTDIFKDLLNFAAKYLTINGHLVYWFPVCRSDYKEENVPVHPCLKLIANSEQPLSTRVGRRLITMKKVKPYEVNELDDSPLYSASILVDHYADASFREKYFEMYQENGIAPENNKIPETALESM